MIVARELLAVVVEDATNVVGREGIASERSILIGRDGPTRRCHLCRPLLIGQASAPPVVEGRPYAGFHPSDTLASLALSVPTQTVTIAPINENQSPSTTFGIAPNC